MKLLWVKYGKILPVDTGGKLRSFNLLRELGRRVDLTFFSYYGGPSDPGYGAALAAALPGSVAVCVPDVPIGTGGIVARFLGTVGSPAPFTVSRFSSTVARERLAGMLDTRHFDVALCDFLAPTLVVPVPARRTAVGPPWILFEHNVESDLWSRRFAAERRWHRRPVYWWEHRRVRAWETRMLRSYDRTLAVSSHDRDRFEALAPGTNAHVVQTGVDLGTFHPVDGQAPRPGLVAFVGSMDWEPNIDGVEWFCREIWPSIRARNPGARFRIVGRAPSAAVRKWEGPDIEVTGSVPSVVEHLREAEVVVVPLRVGGGTRLKIYEAMATGAPVVSTAIGAEGLELQEGREILLRDDPSSFAEAVLALLGDTAHRRALAEGGRRHALRFGWAHVADQLFKYLQTVRPRG